jgi:hypothetical protein
MIDKYIKQKETGIYVDNLVPVIDRLIEKTEDYEKRIKQDYGISYCVHAHVCALFFIRRYSDSTKVNEPSKIKG